VKFHYRFLNKIIPIVFTRLELDAGLEIDGEKVETNRYSIIEK